jgi:hypothetical protein
MIFNSTRPEVSLPLTIPRTSAFKAKDWRYLGHQRSGDKLLKFDGTDKLITSFKDASIEFARKNTNSIVKYIIDHAPVRNQHVRILIDVKIHYMEVGGYTCMKGWHLDGSVNAKSIPKKPEVHHLFIAGVCGHTEFLDTKVDLPIDESLNFVQISKKVGGALDNTEGLPVFAVPNSQYVTYGDHDFHRPAKIMQSGYRLMVRVTETDVLEPRNKIMADGKFLQVIF